MGDFRRLRNDCTPDRTSSVRSSSPRGSLGSNSVARQQALPPQPSITSPPPAENVRPEGLTSFLRAFPTLEAFCAKFPELQTMSLPDPITEDAAEEFAGWLQASLEPERSSKLTAQHAPIDVLRGLAELRARAGDRKPARLLQREAKKDKSEQPEEEKRPARTRTGLATLPHLLDDRERGVRQRRAVNGPRCEYSNVLHHPIAGPAMMTKYDVERVAAGYAEKYGVLARRIQKNYPKRWESVSSKVPAIATAIRACCGASVACATVPMTFDDRMKEYFFKVAAAESVIRFLQRLEAEDLVLEGDTAAQLYRTVVGEIAAAVSGEAVRGMFLLARTDPVYDGRNAFEKLLVATVTTFHRKGDYGEAEAVFRTGSKRLEWPESADGRCVGRAADYKVRVLAELPGPQASGLTPRNHALLQSLVSEISFDYHLYHGGNAAVPGDMALALCHLFGLPLSIDWTAVEADQM